MADWSKFQNYCLFYSESFPLSSNINQETSRIQKIIRSAANQSIPQSSIKSGKPSPLWWNSELSVLRHNKQHTWQQFKRNRSSTNLIAYKKANALFRRKAKIAKSECFQKFTSTINSSSDPKKIWAKIKRLSGLPSFSPISSLNTPRGNLLYPQDIALEFANNFSNFSSDTNFSPEFSANKLSLLSYTHRPSHQLSPSAKWLDSELSIFELKVALSTVKGKTPGIDKISYPIIRHLPSPFLSRLTNHYNNIFRTGIFPQLWKTSAIIPILKPGKPASEITSYRPISLIPCLGKLMEKIVATRLSWYLHSNNLIHPNQVAFKKGQSTIDALLHLDHFISDALSSKNHVSLLSLDFEKAFDRIGIQVILRQLIKWKVGPRIYNFVKSFLSKRKIKVLISNISSPTLPLDNGTPQGSPLSVILFTIAFDEISSILSNFPNIRHQIYADDILLFSKSSNLNSTVSTFEEILSSLSAWSCSSGASISYTKSKLLHICKKHNCNFPTLTFNNAYIPCSNSLKFLGIVLDSKYSFKHHCQYLRNRLISNSNIVKYLSCKRSFIGPALLVNVVRALILSVINYALEIYGHHAKNNLKMLAAPYHTAIRRSLRAFPTSPIKNILAESGLPFLKDNMEDSIYKLYSKLILGSNQTLRNAFYSTTKRNRLPKLQSTIYKCAIFAKVNNLPLRTPHLRKPRNPPWLVSKSSFIDRLSLLPKSTTTNVVYNCTFRETMARFKQDNWRFVFTDGSKAVHTTFAVVSEKNEPISYGLLFPFCSIFTAEATAILHAVQHVINNTGKYIICTDSQSCFQAINNCNNTNNIISFIRDTLISYPNKIKIMWVPSHTGINGNTYADKMAKDTTFIPTVTSSLFIKSDIYRLVNQKRRTKLALDWIDYNHHYSRINPTRIKPHYPSTIPTNMLTPFIRLRIAHTILTHAHLLERGQIHTCPFCDASTSVLHLIAFCPGLNAIRQQNFTGSDPISLLMNPTEENIRLMYGFLKDADLLRRI